MNDKQPNFPSLTDDYAIGYFSQLLYLVRGSKMYIFYPTTKSWRVSQYDTLCQIASKSLTYQEASIKFPLAFNHQLPE